MKTIWPKSIATSLLVWILVISIAPLLLVSWYAYTNAVLDIEMMQRHKLEDTAGANVQFVNNWFEQIYTNLNMWSENQATQQYLATLEKKWRQSAQPLQEFTGSTEYRKLLEIHDDYMKRRKENYDYVYDLFLIDLKGNILYTVAKESDLGTNLMDGKYQNTRFAQAYRATLGDQKAHFSDLEYYEPSHRIVAGFICIPMKGKTGETTGIMALQLHLGSIIRQFDNSKSADGIKHYLVGYEGLLRTPIKTGQEMLRRRVSSKQFWRWYTKHGLFGTPPEKRAEDAFIYLGPDGHNVLGQYHAIEFLGVNWVQISEVDETMLHVAPDALAKKIALIVLLNIFLIIAVSVWFARRITGPVKKLNLAALSYVEGNKEIQIVPESKDEIGELANSFQNMIDVQKANEAYLHELLDSLKEQKYALDSHSIVAITDVKGTITFVNQKFEEISGYTYEELVGKNHRILNSGLHPAPFWAEMYKTLSHGNQWHAVVRNKAKNGSFYWVDTTIVPFIGKDGKPKSYIAIRTDITHQKQTEVELNEALTLQKAVFDNAGVSIIITDQSGLITSMNIAAEKMVGYKKEELIGQSPAVIHKMEEVVERAHLLSILFDEVIEPGFKVFVAKSDHDMVNADEWTYVRKDGSELTVYLAVTALRDADNTIYGYMGIASDISILKEAEVQMMIARDEAENSARAKSEFLAAMSHEIRTPLNGVLGMLGLLEQTELDSTQRHRVHVAQSSATSLLGLINDILDFSKIEAGKMDLENIEFNLRDELGEFAESIAFRAQEKGLELILDTTQVHVQNIIADPGRLRQIMTNIVGNAVKFTHRGHILIRVSTTSIDENRGALNIEIRDTGIGISPEKINTLFEAFTQADGSTTRKYGGTGLGLSIVKRLCELMGGRVDVHSVLHQGSTFSVQIEIGLGNNSKPGIPSTSVEGKTVLIIDDNEVNRAVVRTQLEQWGMSVYEAEDAIGALDGIHIRIHEGVIPPFDVALVDMQMPDMDGAQLGKEIRKTVGCDGMRLVMMTSLGSRHDAKVFSELGFNAFFAKPVTARDLLNALKVLFEDGEALRGAFPLLTKDYLGTLKKEHSEMQWSASTRILLVEDNTTNQLVAQGMLESIGLRADIATNGLEALELLQLAVEESAPYTLVLMDCQMPEMDGYTASEAIRAGKAGEANRTIPIVAMTANAMNGDREKCIVAGMDDYMSKPINLSVLKTIVLKWLLNEAGDEVVSEKKGPKKPVPPPLSLWDESEALSRMEGNSALLGKIITSFLLDSKTMLTALKTAIEEGNLGDSQLHAHSIKGSAGNVGALKLQSVAKELETAAHDKELATLIEKFPQCEQVLSDTLEVLEVYLANRTVSVKKQKRLDPLEMAIKLQGLKNEIKNGAFIDTDELGIFAEYADSRLSEQMDTLKRFIDQFETDKAVQSIDTIMAELE